MTGSMRSLRIEIGNTRLTIGSNWTGSMRSLRIEIRILSNSFKINHDRLHAEPEDRNRSESLVFYYCLDRLHAEPEDRNVKCVKVNFLFD